jgi:hypothetical protein
MDSRSIRVLPANRTRSIRGRVLARVDLSFFLSFVRICPGYYSFILGISRPMADGPHLHLLIKPPKVGMQQAPVRFGVWSCQLRVQYQVSFFVFVLICALKFPAYFILGTARPVAVVRTCSSLGGIQTSAGTCLTRGRVLVPVQQFFLSFCSYLRIESFPSLLPFHPRYATTRSGGHTCPSFLWRSLIPAGTRSIRGWVLHRWDVGIFCPPLKKLKHHLVRV